ncbi:uncharacterized protein LOC125855220 [Solanum stenotomum]|uniref:uncharacterized protein LOC125855220 n=1 Tax=Solanum stenotomum TaxID=172797 RepID=UPI0020D15BDF|nr:uncharacterized protein LOC125855220 [Solanum stenotomum]
MPIPEWKWEMIAIDFVVGLPKTLGKFDSIWVVLDKLTKSAHFIPVRVDYNMQQLAKVYVKEIVRLHGVPLPIISGCGTQFTSKFWGKLHKELDTQFTFSITFHPQRDGQSERAIQAYHSHIDMAPFEALFGRGCRSPIRWFEVGDVKPLGFDLVKDAQDKASEQVLLLVSPIKGLRRFRKKGKFSPRYIGPFEILHCVGPLAYRLALPRSLSGVHLVFHVSMLKKYHGDSDYIIKWDSVLLDKDIQYEEEPVAILDRDI